MKLSSKTHLKSGFTLVELSIVLVIIGLIVGGVLVGQDLISAATVRSQIKQIEGYQAATNTFRVKYGYLPGDIPDPAATQYGFASRGSNPGQGDGNGLIQTNLPPVATGPLFIADELNQLQSVSATGEQGTFWADLSTAKLISGNFIATPTGSPTTTSLTQYYPEAKLGQGNYIAIMDDGVHNYFAIFTATTGLINGINFGVITPWVGMTVAQAYAMDKKIDDGFPLTGRVTAAYNAEGNGFPFGSELGFFFLNSPPDTGNSAPNQYTCYDNDGVANATQHYSMGYKNGALQNCGVVIQFQ